MRRNYQYVLLLRPFLIITFLDPKMNVLLLIGSKNRFANFVNPKLAIFRASTFGYRLRVDPHPKKAAQYPKKAFGCAFPYVMEGNKRATSWIKQVENSINI